MQLHGAAALALVDVVVALLAAVVVAQVVEGAVDGVAFAAARVIAWLVEGVWSFKLVGDTWALRLS